MNMTIDAPPPCPPDPPPAALGLVCPGCRGTKFRTAWQTFKDGSRHVRMSCAACNKFLKYLKKEDELDFRHEPRRTDASAFKLRPPPESWVWIGYIRQADQVWRPVAMAPTLERCWDTLLHFPGDGDFLAAPSVPPPSTSTNATPAQETNPCRT
jgi:hypothetical protein